MEDPNSPKTTMKGNLNSLAISKILPQSKTWKCNAENFAETQNMFNIVKSRSIFALSAENENSNGGKIVDQTVNVESYWDVVVLEQIKYLIARHATLSIFFSTLKSSTLSNNTVNIINTNSKTVLDQMSKLIMASRRQATKQKKLISLEQEVIHASIDLHTQIKEIGECLIDEESIESLLKTKTKYLKRSKLFAIICLRLLNSFSVNYIKDKELKEIHYRLSYVDSLDM